MSTRVFWSALSAFLVAGLLGSPAIAEPPPKEPGWGFSLLAGIGGGGRDYEVLVDTPNLWLEEDSWVNAPQWFVDARLLAPPLDIGSQPRPFVIAGYTRSFGGATETFSIQNRVGLGNIESEFEQRWWVGAGLSFPVRSGSGRTFMEINPWVGYGQERAENRFVIANGNRFLSFNETETFHQVVPGLEFSFPVAPLGDVGHLHLAVGGQAAIDVSGGDSGSQGIFVPLEGRNFANVVYDRSQVGWAAYAAIRFVFDGF